MTITECAFANVSENGNGGAVTSVGLFTAVTNCTITNSSTRGDWWRNVSTMSGLTILADSTIAHSSATGTAGSGGAIEVAASLTITGSIFIGCSADQYGGAMYIRGGDLTATNVTIRGSSAQMGAGALYMTDGEVSFLTSTIVNSTTRTASACSARRSSSRSTRRCSGAPRWRGGAARRRSANGARRGPIRHRARHRRN
jgi:hypothetical protein